MPEILTAQVLDHVERCIKNCGTDAVPTPKDVLAGLLVMAREYNKLADQMRKLETCSVHGCKVTIRKDCWWCAGETLDGIGG